ncbi:MAG TPA: hypothetical protein RMF84_01870, partial [Polyangiaceae bacterium LLY-WYZ-14_1]|nr:hypothetical protein [Polyangiaceae bacterium LLY-WYZ-14_1]
PGTDGPPDVVAEHLRPLAVPVASLTPMPPEENARAHGEEDLRAIAESLLRFGQQTPVVFRGADGVVVAGNGTLLAIRDLIGAETVAAVPTTLEGDEAAGFAIADNRAGDLSVADDARLARVVAGWGEDAGELAKAAGIADRRLAKLSEMVEAEARDAPPAEAWGFEVPVDAGDAVPRCTCPHCGARFVR